MSSVRSGFARTALALALALASGAACALGLGQIEVKSRAGQPLLAEIPVISTGPEELAQLRAGLASPETFRRIGLDAPQGIVTDLRFTLALDAAGKPVIRVTSTQPVTQPALTFLIEVDWGQGRLTREYSALIDAPRTVSAPMQPPIQSATGANPNTIERPLDAPLPFGAQPAATDPLAVENQLDRYDPGSVIAPGEPQAQPLPAEPIAVEADPVPAAPAQPAPQRPNAGKIPREPREPRPVAAAPKVAAEGDITVQGGQTLSGIAAGLSGPHTLNQTMIALLRANPEAFIGNNINRLRQGAVLRLPPTHQLATLDPREASELVRVQVQQWRQGVASAPVPQPIGLESDAVAKAPVAPAANAPGAARSDDARLEIVPPGASRATQAGAQSGISAGGEGDMVRQDNQQTTETLAAREQELAELKSKVADLEQLQSKQQKLIAMKDSELAASQQRLAEQQARSDGGSPLPWIFGGLGVLALLVGGWVMSRREPKKPAFRAPLPGADVASERSAPLADPVDSLRRRPEPAAPVIDPVAQLLGESETDSPAKPADPVPAAASTVAEEPASAPFWTAPKAEPQNTAKVPTWHSGEVGTSAARSGAAPARVEPAVAPAAAVAAAAAPAQANQTPANPGQTNPGQERIELARAYLDLGDQSSARQLLGEVLINGDHAARQQAARLLREIEASS
ncbi:FimV/HubP family polar landmark protein [Lysobacter sp. Root690]|uniref:FimV/HubP family polar landmark protein n=1 Tax=Lysobacter sp. Root690 TaxID=1736588 RepID=UPI0012F92D68|nr:FimV/HubP family polar landmark protein [Lysobacter sp. Root690]